MRQHLHDRAAIMRFDCIEISVFCKCKLLLHHTSHVIKHWMLPLVEKMKKTTESDRTMKRSMFLIDLLCEQTYLYMISIVLFV